jgi:2-C-methyl-D-erythritol 4-phosphate cytidylyltransferase
MASPQAQRFVIQGDDHLSSDELLAESEPYPASVYGDPESDTCKEVVDGLVRRTVPRETLAVARGPWVFTRQALADGLSAVAGREAEIPDLIAFCEAGRVRVRVLPDR